METGTQRTLFLRVILLTFMLLVVFQNGYTCSGYKVTIGNKTLFGSNEDAWRVTPHIWFENARGKGEYGAAFTGSRYDGENGYAPQSGMNEMGVVFERLSSHHPQSKGFPNRKAITNPTKYLKDILHSCKTVEEVQKYISKYDHSYFIEDIFIYVDKSGKYLIVEPYTLTIGNDPTYVISNFCPSITSKKDANQLERYRNGVSFLKNNIDTTLEFCKALSDTMHVCREKIGDGTLLTSIWDLNKGTVNLYFYHQYKTTVQFNLKEELGKGDHLIAIEPLFPSNSEFEKLRNYKTPKNSALIAVFLIASAGLFLFSSIYFLIMYFRRKQNGKHQYIHLLMFILGLILFCYMVVLCVGSVNRFYFPAPYKDPASVFVSLTAYIPSLLLVLIVPFWVVNRRLFKEQHWNLFSRWLFTLNNLVYTILIGLFVYWGFYDD
ncbi:hypothetical protein [Fluviicola taffensis]|uniref:Choloylglycine hydrolase/NAAA C-terminal domain-containing protein n=1 Tax=Fluviicola taffensis (strain DSM 16823 / NCIMB 13979 / RW262) TaxID=755732 RepID=F2ICG9_FLUTR|nr:hypothetical protein [Fluviicola taffensis]AEA45439.1 hypothetical protein Fluta_3467 [Fluviicola taffensis DSM 16823]